MASTVSSNVSSTSSNETTSTTAPTECLTDFVRTGRTGRRNAVPDVFIDPNISVTTASITDLMFKFDCNDSKNGNAEAAN
jgi:hypothetical protein